MPEKTLANSYIACRVPIAGALVCHLLYAVEMLSASGEHPATTIMPVTIIDTTERHKVVSLERTAEKLGRMSLLRESVWLYQSESLI